MPQRDYLCLVVGGWWYYHPHSKRSFSKKMSRFLAMLVAALSLLSRLGPSEATPQTVTDDEVSDGGGDDAVGGDEAAQDDDDDADSDDDDLLTKTDKCNTFQFQEWIADLVGH